MNSITTEKPLYSIRIVEDTEGVVWAYVATDANEPERFQIPPHMAAQMGMALQMMREQLG